MSLKISYTFLAPVYDLIAGPTFRAARRDSLAVLPREPRGTVLINGVGSGLDFQFLPRVLSDEPAAAGGWFRRLLLERT